ncbi:MAG: alpha/beta fold hydrolase [Caldilineae bacterium]|nr:MAG: alpha/beta fold hydrolase [Caldilineae bacterium]
MTASVTESTVADILPGWTPPAPVRNGHVQTLLARIPPEDAQAVTSGEQPFLIDAGKDYTGFDPERSVRLLAFYTAHKTAGPRRGLVMTLHGWEGSSHSNYNLSIGSALVQAGYDVVRLNFRDHGPTHHLNKGFFYATLIEEVLTATQRVAWMAGDDPFYLVGASMGGNFALRLAVEHQRSPIHNLRHVLAINPAIDPDRTCTLLDEHTLYRIYFRRRWLQSLRKKQALFPELFDFRGIERLMTIREMSDWLVKKYGPFRDVDEYLASYAVPMEPFKRLTTRVTVLTAANDPIIDVNDFRHFPQHPLLNVHILATGGHVGYVDVFPLRHLLPELTLAIFGT